MTILTTYEAINKAEWETLISHSQTATWFQTQAAYDFYAEQPELFIPFAIAVVNDGLKGVCVGYVTHEANALNQFFTRRAIIIGGPALADDASQEEVCALMTAVRNLLSHNAIYIETRNFNDYSRWHGAFIQAGFSYEPHLNFHVDTTSMERVHKNLSTNRKRDIFKSIKKGVTIIENPTIEQIREFYPILHRLYTTKVKTPLFPLAFFERLATHPGGKVLLVEFQGNIVGGLVTVVLENRCLYTWFGAGADGVYHGIHPSSVARYAGLKYAAEHSIPRFDFMGAGKPGVPYGVREFKARFGGKEVEHGRFKHICCPIMYKLGELGVNILKRI